MTEIQYESIHGGEGFMLVYPNPQRELVPRRRAFGLDRKRRSGGLDPWGVASGMIVVPDTSCRAIPRGRCRA
jgi:hypothetical protein